MSQEKQLKPFETRIVARFAETDMMQVIHHANYFVWFEEARWEFLHRVLNIMISDLQQRDIAMPIIHCECQYKQAIRWGETVIIAAQLELLQGSYFTFHYQIRRLEKNEIVGLGKTKHVFTNKNLQLKLEIPDIFKQAYTAAIKIYPEAFIALGEIVPNA